jgi:hypothetical protein
LRFDGLHRLEAVLDVAAYSFQTTSSFLIDRLAPLLMTLGRPLSHSASLAHFCCSLGDIDAMTAMKLKTALTGHWFLPLALAIITADFALAHAVEWRPARPLEAGVLLDVAVLVPVLYALCYRRRGRAAWIRAGALACLGIWLAGRIIPAAHQDLLAHLGPLRYAGMAVLFLIELRLAIAIYRAAFSDQPEQTQRTLAAAEQAGVPRWVTRLMAWEASLWRCAWQRVRRWGGRATLLRREA